MELSTQAQVMSGVLLVIAPTIAYGGTFLLQVLSGKSSIPLTLFQKSMFRAGHAHAGVLVILALLAQLFIDAAHFQSTVEWPVRIGFASSPLLVSGGFFASAVHRCAEKPNRWIALIWVGAVVLASVLLILGIALIRTNS
jgi:hypothetical protein